MNVNKGILIRIKPNATQRDSLERHFGQNRFLWNYFLDKRKREYQESKQGSNYYRDAAELTNLKQQPEYNWLYESSIASQQRTLKTLDDAYKRFFKGHARFPRFKSKRGKQSFTLSGGIKLRDKRIFFPKFAEGIKFSRMIPHHTKINSITVTKTASGLYYVALSVEATVRPLRKTRKSIGLDLGLKDFAVLSNGKRIKNPRHLRLHEKALRRAQQHLSRKEKGTNRREGQRIKVARLHERIANARKDFLHQASAHVVKRFDTIAVEDLAVKNLLRNHSLAKHIADAGWGTFLRMLGYKSEWYGKTLVTVNRFYPSSKTCGDCGFINQSLKLDDRKWTCTNCDTQHDRDWNAARNILREAKRISARQSPKTDAEKLSACA
jgi:putative transposase